MNKKIMLWKKPPYVEHSSIAFEASITEYKVNDKKTAVIVCPGGGYFGNNLQRKNKAHCFGRNPHYVFRRKQHFIFG